MPCNSATENPSAATTRASFFAPCLVRVNTSTDGIWKIKKLFYRAFWHGTMEEGWAHTPPDYVPNASVTYPEDPYGPDEPLENAPRLWPETTTLPFHYKHPVTGKEFVPDTWGVFPEG